MNFSIKFKNQILFFFFCYNYCVKASFWNNNYYCPVLKTEGKFEYSMIVAKLDAFSKDAL